MNNLLRIDTSDFTPLELGIYLYSIGKDLPFTFSTGYVKLKNWDITVDPGSLSRMLDQSLYERRGRSYYPTDKLKFLIGDPEF